MFMLQAEKQKNPADELDAGKAAVCLKAGVAAARLGLKREHKD